MTQHCQDPPVNRQATDPCCIPYPCAYQSSDCSNSDSNISYSIHSWFSLLDRKQLNCLEYFLLVCASVAKIFHSLLSIAIPTAHIWDQSNCLPLPALVCSQCHGHRSLAVHVLVARSTKTICKFGGSVMGSNQPITTCCGPK